MSLSLLLLSILAIDAHSAAADPLLDLSAQGYGGVGFAMDIGHGFDVLGRAGGALTFWVVPQAGLVLRADTGSFGLIEDTSNTFIFGEVRARVPERDLAMGLGLGTNALVFTTLCPPDEPCEPELWGGHRAVGTLSVTLERGLGPLHMPVALRLEGSEERLGLGLDLGLGWRFKRGGGS